MRRTRWIAVVVLSVFGVFAVFDRAEAQSYEAAEYEVVELINAYRQANGLGPLSLSSPLSVAAERHSEDMGTYGFFSHDTVQSSYYAPGSSHAERIAQEGYGYNTFTAENLAYGQATAQEAFEAWRASPGHNAAMLGDYSVIGVGLSTVGGVPYWTTVFGAEADPSTQPTNASPASGTAVEDPGTQPLDAGQPEPAAEAQYEEPATDLAAAVGEQYEETGSEAPAAAGDQYGVPSNEQYDEPVEPDTSAAEQYGAEADRFRAAAAQYRDEAERAAEELSALEVAQSEPAAPVTSTPVEQTAVTPEPQTSAPASSEQEIPDAAPVEDAPVESDPVGQAGLPSEKMAAVGMVVLPDTGGLSPAGVVIGAALITGALVAARRVFG